MINKFMVVTSGEKGDTNSYWHSGAFKNIANTPFFKLDGRYTGIHFIIFPQNLHLHIHYIY